MSRFSEQFENHPLHKTLEQAKSWIAVDTTELDADLEIERRRLSKVLGLITEILESTDPEVFPEAAFNNLNNHLRHQSFWQQLSLYSSNHQLQHLRTANDHITGHLPEIFKLPNRMFTPDVRKDLGAVETAYDKFCKAVAEREAEFDASLNEGKDRLSAAEDALQNVRSALDSVTGEVNESLNQWQTEFTDAQTRRAEEHSAGQIERGEKFDEAVRSWNTEADKQTKVITQKYDQSLKAVFDALNVDIATRQKDIASKHDAIREIHGLVGTDGVAGGYQRSATDEQSAANFWRWIAMGALAAAALWILLKYWMGLVPSGSNPVNWAELITAGSLTLVLLGAAGYAARQSKIHRETEQQMRWFALEVKAIDPFLSSLPENERSDLKKRLSEKLFGRNRSNGSDGEQVDPNALKTVVDAVLTPVQEIIKNSSK